MAEESSNMPFKKKWENFWFYHKNHVIVGIMGVILFVWLVHDLVNEDTYDYQIMFTARGYFSEETKTAIKEQFAVLGEDIDGDGQVTVNLVYIQMPTLKDQYTDYQTEQAGQVKIIGEISSEETLIYIMDENLISYFFGEDMSVFDMLSESYPDNELISDYFYDLGQSSAFSEITGISDRTDLDKLYLMVREYQPKNENKTETKKELARKEIFEQQTQLVTEFIEANSK